MEDHVLVLTLLVRRQAIATNNSATQETWEAEQEQQKAEQEQQKAEQEQQKAEQEQRKAEQKAEQRKQILAQLKNNRDMQLFVKEYGKNLYVDITRALPNIPMTHENYQIVAEHWLQRYSRSTLIDQMSVDSKESLTQIIEKDKDRIQKMRKQYRNSKGTKKFIRKYGSEAYEAIVSHPRYVGEYIAIRYDVLVFLHESGVDYRDLADKYFNEGITGVIGRLQPTDDEPHLISPYAKRENNAPIKVGVDVYNRDGYIIVWIDTGFLDLSEANDPDELFMQCVFSSETQSLSFDLRPARRLVICFF